MAVARFRGERARGAARGNAERNDPSDCCVGPCSVVLRNVAVLVNVLTLAVQSSTDPSA